MSIYQALYKGEIIASGPFAELVQLEGNLYFPEICVETDLFEKSDTTTVCPWKGTAHYYNFKDAKDIAWYYPDPKEKAVEIKGMVAFYCSKHPGDLVVEELVEGKWGRVPRDEEEGEKAKEDEK